MTDIEAFDALWRCRQIQHSRQHAALLGRDQPSAYACAEAPYARSPQPVPSSVPAAPLRRHAQLHGWPPPAERSATASGRSLPASISISAGACSCVIEQQKIRQRLGRFTRALPGKRFRRDPKIWAFLAPAARRSRIGPAPRRSRSHPCQWVRVTACRLPRGSPAARRN